MAPANKFSNPKDREIHDLHLRYTAAMEDRLPAISDQTREHYLGVLKSLTQKLEIPGKPLSEIISEVMGDAAPLLFQAMQR
jgi:hypothetical protein